MSYQLLETFVKQMVESRVEDVEKARIANNSYLSMLKHIRSLGTKVSAFNAAFSKTNGYFFGFKLETNIPREEHTLLSIYFMERSLFNIKSALNAKAIRNWASNTDPTTKDYTIHIYFDAPKEVVGDPTIYNKWFAENLAEIVSNEKLRSSYVHEFTHIMDYRRVSPAYLVNRTAAKNAEKQNMAATGTSKRDFEKYVNDPLEMNAYFQQAIADVVRKLKNLDNTESKIEFLGKTPQEFVEKFMTSFLKKAFRKNLSPENQQRIIKRAATAYDKIVAKYVN
jgi:hypothetical protein